MVKIKNWKNRARTMLGLLLCLSVLIQPLSALASQETISAEKEIGEMAAEAASALETTEAAGPEETGVTPGTDTDVKESIEETEPAATQEPETAGDAAAQESGTDGESTEESSEDIGLYQAAVPVISYQTHVQKAGWVGQSSNGAENGTTGQARRLEAIKIWLDSAPVSGGVEYRTHCQTYGWLGWVSGGAESGTTGQAKRLEAIQIRLTGEMAKKYDIYYRVHCQSFDWTGWAKNGAPAGSMGYAKRLESIQIVLVEKDGPAPGPTDNSYRENLKVTYQTHVQKNGWIAESSNGAANGTTGEAKRLEGIKIRLENHTLVDGSVEYHTHVQSYGWQDWVKEGQMAGTTGEAKRLEAIEIRLTGAMADAYDIYYRVHCQSFGWTGWGKNGASVGSEGYAKRLEAIEIVLVAKGGAAPGSTENAFYMKSKPTVMEDRYFQTNARGALANGIPIGGYVYNYASTPEEAKREAELAVSILKNYQVAYPIVFDLEVAENMADKLNNMAMAKAFCSVLQDAGYETWVYGSPSKLKSKFDYDQIASLYGIWLARYRWDLQYPSLQFNDAGIRSMVKSTGYEGNGYTGLTNVKMWQYTQQGRVNGISGNVDLDLGYYPERWGVDVSAHQGAVNWPRAKADGVEFAMLRITQKYVAQ